MSEFLKHGFLNSEWSMLCPYTCCIQPSSGGISPTVGAMCGADLALSKKQDSTIKVY